MSECTHLQMNYIMIPLNHIRAAGKTTENSLQALGALIHREELVHLFWSASLLIYSHALKMSIQSADLTYFPLWNFFPAILLQNRKQNQDHILLQKLNQHHKVNITLFYCHHCFFFPSRYSLGYSTPFAFQGQMLQCTRSPHAFHPCISTDVHRIFYQKGGTGGLGSSCSNALKTIHLVHI